MYEVLKNSVFMHAQRTVYCSKKKVDLMVDMFTPQPPLNKNSKLDPIEEADNMPS